MKRNGDRRQLARVAILLTTFALIVGACSSASATPTPAASAAATPAATPAASAPASAAPASAAASATPGSSGGTADWFSTLGSRCAGTPLKVGVDISLNNTDFWTSWISYINQYAPVCDMTTIQMVSNNDPATEFSDIKSMIDQGAQGIIASPADSSAIASSLELAASKNIPVVSNDVAPSEGAGKVYMIVRADNVLYGQESCQYIAEHAPHAGTIAILEGALSSLNGLDRTNGCKQILQDKYPNFKVAEYATKWDTPTAVNDAKTAISTYQDLVGIYAEWSAPEDGVIAALQTANKFFPIGNANHVVIVGNDGTPHEHDLIRQGQLDATVSQPANYYAALSMVYIRDALNGVVYTAGQKTDHNSTIVALNGNLEDAVQAPIVDKSNVDDPNLWGSGK